MARVRPSPPPRPARSGEALRRTLDRTLDVRRSVLAPTAPLRTACSTSHYSGWISMNTHEDALTDLLGISGRARDALVADDSTTRVAKSTLRRVASAIKRGFASALALRLVAADERAPALLVGIFQHPRYFDEEKARYA